MVDACGIKRKLDTRRLIAAKRVALCVRLFDVNRFDTSRINIEGRITVSSAPGTICRAGHADFFISRTGILCGTPCMAVAEVVYPSTGSCIV